MQIYKDLKDLPLFSKPACLSIGYFDGVHLGHQHLFSHLQKKDALSVLVSFPSLKSVKPSPSICSLEHKLKLLEEAGIDLLLLLPFEEISSLSFSAFLDQIQKHFLALHLVLGKGSVFGKDREGTEERIREYAQKNSLLVDYIDKLQQREEIISSSSVRKAILEGDLGLVQKLLGRPLSYRFSPPFSFDNPLSPYPSHDTLTLPFKDLVSLPQGIYEVFVESASKSFSSLAHLSKETLKVAVPLSKFAKEEALSLLFSSAKKNLSFSLQHKIKDLYV